MSFVQPSTPSETHYSNAPILEKGYTLEDKRYLENVIEACTTKPPKIPPPFTCVLCHENSTGYGNNPAPLQDSGKCCDDCNRAVVFYRLSSR